ncbi:MAG TPA: OmpA family protein [Polyangiaceae bacterium]|nr:OmpA family protein [Polyangiaceae bacterium]
MFSCAEAPRLRGRVAGLEKVVEQAERNGAVRCAPIELALARSQLKFASLELDQGFPLRAQAHLVRAEPQARAALALSPPEYCATRAYVQIAGDRDGDGFPDDRDRCPEQPENLNNFEDADGCPDDPDTDGDGVSDSRDACDLEAEDRDSYLDDDGCPDLDNDVDGALDPDDKCPVAAEDPDGYEDADGCPDPDNDGDSVPDVKDQCPNEIGSTTSEPLGCPQKPALVLVTDCEVKITQQIHFEFNQDRIRRESYPILDAVAEVLSKNSAIKVEVQGHTDNVGSPAYNRDLSNRRAGSVRKYLVARGITPARLSSVGYGMERPLVDNTSEQNRSLNRRVQFVRTEGVKEGCPKTRTP